MAEPAGPGLPPLRAPLLLLSVLAVATCGLVYELIAGTLASYLLGDSIFQFSTVIGVYLSAMGAGAALSRYVEGNVARRFVEVELGVALVGGWMAPLLFIAFAHSSAFQAVLYGMVFATGTLVGLEIPLLLRILQDGMTFKDLVARVLTADYIGALVASLAFPMLMLPRMGVVRTGLFMGLVNALVGLATTWLLRERLGELVGLRTKAVLVAGVLAAGLGVSEQLTTLAEGGIYADDVVYARQTAYQRIVVTRARTAFQLFLNGALQFSSADEYRYHEALVHPAFAVGRPIRHVLVLGGGDGLAVREVLKQPGVEHVTLVDLDRGVTDLATRADWLRNLNESSLLDPRVTVIHDDAMTWLEDHAVPGGIDLMVVDFPDPSNFSVGKLYTTRFYALARAALSPGGLMVVQTTSPLFARRSFWCIARTIEASGMFVRPYHAWVPSFGAWGYTLASALPFDVPVTPPPFARSLGNLPSMFEFPPDMAAVETEVNRLHHQVLVHLYEEEARAVN